MQGFNIEELRELTLQAIDHKKKLSLVEEDNNLLKNNLRHQEAKAWAELKLLEFISASKKAAIQGKNCIAVVNTRNDYYATKTHSYNKFDGWNYDGVGLKYWYLHLMLTDRELEVDVKFEHDGVGISSWYTMYAKW